MLKNRQICRIKQPQNKFAGVAGGSINNTKLNKFPLLTKVPTGIYRKNIDIAIEIMEITVR